MSVQCSFISENFPDFAPIFESARLSKKWFKSLIRPQHMYVSDWISPSLPNKNYLIAYPQRFLAAKTKLDV